MIASYLASCPKSLKVISMLTLFLETTPLLTFVFLTTPAYTVPSSLNHPIGTSITGRTPKLT